VRPGTPLQSVWEEFDLDQAIWAVQFKKLRTRKFREAIREPSR